MNILEVSDLHSGYGKIEILKGIDIRVPIGRIVSLIGSNGAGKSTLLKILSRITDPTHGRAEIYGRVGSLLEVGTGFHPELTGRENIYLNGAVLGMKKAEMDRKFDEIVSFSEVERFIDTPVKRYSSGMYVRLAFAVAAHLEPEILLFDEPTAGLDPITAAEIEALILELKTHREMTSVVVHFPGVMPRILKSSGRASGLRLASSTAALIPSTNAVTIASPCG